MPDLELRHVTHLYDPDKARRNACDRPWPGQHLSEYWTKTPEMVTCEHCLLVIEEARA